ncbi:MAG TPA: four-carbon acid sugar kinase family protein, partial [Pseudonocardiaceae bacterium]|nr:four-carbon acid sugar kinase family protein [Pseudonocardiaceae bacterium]
MNTGGAGLLAAYYSDDFTGATDMMELLTCSGAATTVFLHPPSDADLARHPETRCVGVAGDTRTKTREEIAEELPSALRRLAATGAQIVQYKVCSTFDSSPAVGNIGRALEIGGDVCAQDVLPVVGGSPHLGRYCCFGTLFASHGQDGEVFRLDRHPTMSEHPVTPMREADLTRLLGAQTSLPVRGLGFPTLHVLPDELERSGRRVLVIDALTDEHLRLIGRALWEHAHSGGTRFVAGPAGVGRALVLEWQRLGLAHAAPLPAPDPVEQVVVLSGSASPVTAHQIEHAERAGYVRISLPSHVDGGGYRQLRQVIASAVTALEQGRNVVVHPHPGRRADSRVLDQHLGEVANALLDASAVRRFVVCGGDTCGAVARAIG